MINYFVPYFRIQEKHKKKLAISFVFSTIVSGLVMTSLAWTVKSGRGQMTSPSCSKVVNQVGFNHVLDHEAGVNLEVI